MTLRTTAKRYSNEASCKTHHVEAAFLSGAEIGWRLAWATVRERIKRNRRSVKGLSEEVCTREFEKALEGGTNHETVQSNHTATAAPPDTSGGG